MRTILLAIAFAIFVTQADAGTHKAPGFTLADASGNEVVLPRKHDGVDIYLFWATWCPYCKALMPHLQSMQIEYGDDVRIFALHIRDDEDPAVFMEEKGYDFTLLPDADPVMALYGVKAVPALFLVDGRGTIRFKLYDMVFDDNSAFKAMSHGKRAGRRAPYWSAEIRLRIDQILGEAKADRNIRH